MGDSGKYSDRRELLIERLAVWAEANVTEFEDETRLRAGVRTYAETLKFRGLSHAAWSAVVDQVARTVWDEQAAVNASAARFVADS